MSSSDMATKSNSHQSPSVGTKIVSDQEHQRHDEAQRQLLRDRQKGCRQVNPQRRSRPRPVAKFKRDPRATTMVNPKGGNEWRDQRTSITHID